MDELLSEVAKRVVEAKEASAPPTATAVDRPAPSTKGAHLGFLAGAAADLGTTAYGMKKGILDEGNPLINWAPKGAQLPLGAGMELAGYLLARKLLKDKHPKIFSGALKAMGLVHGGLAASNATKIATHKKSEASPPYPGMVQRPDGSWVDPTFEWGNK